MSKRHRRSQGHQREQKEETLQTLSGQVSKRQRGAYFDEATQRHALGNCAELVRHAVEQTIKGDSEWGEFLGEMIPG